MATQYMATRMRGIKYRSGYDYGNFLIFAVPQTLRVLLPAISL